MRILWCALAILLIAANGPKTATGFTFGDWQVSTDQFNFNWQSGDFSAPSHITLTRPGSDIAADRATGNQKRKFAILTGNVVLHDQRGTLGSLGAGSGPATLTCDELQIDGVTKLYTATGHVHFTQGASRADADMATLNGMTHDLQLHGNVHLVQ